jgi:membrane fusion protein, copper/silver efflux system
MSTTLHETPAVPQPPTGGSPLTSRARRAALSLGAAAVLGAAALTAYLATRSRDAAAGAAGHAHGATAGDAGAASPVSLTAAQGERIGVTYAVATVGPVRREIRTVGQVTFDETRVQAIAPKVDGWVEALYVNATGQPVSVGQPLLAVYSPMLVSAQEELLLARRLARDVASGTDEARRSAEELLTSARRRLAYWDVAPAEVEAIERGGQVRRTLTLRSPVGGHVLEKNVLAGQRIMAGDALYRVADLSTVWIEGEVFEQDLAAVRVGETAHAELQALPGEHFMGRIAYVYPTLNPETRTARVRVVLRNPGLRLKPGMYATLRVEGARRADAVSVPRSAVLVTGERSIVFVRGADGRLAPRDVRVGAASDDRVEILAGLRAGETVVASATFLIDAESNLGSALGAPQTMPALEPGAPAADPHAKHRR